MLLPPVKHFLFVCGVGLLLVLPANPIMADEPVAEEAGAAADAGPFAAHNAYPWRLYPPKRFEQALDAGLKYIELDITYDPTREVAVVTHDGTPTGTEPALGDMIDELVRRWRDGAANDYRIILDFKTASPELVAQVQELLEPHAELLSKMPKTAEGEFQPGKITVYLTGSGTAHRIFAENIPADGTYLAFCDGGVQDWQPNAADHVPAEPAAYCRFLTYHYSVLLDAPDARRLDRLSQERAEALVKTANERGYKIRIYSVNPPRQSGGGHDFAAWEKCAAAGIHMIATDAYDLSRSWWNEHHTEYSPSE